MADIFAKQIGAWTKDGETIGGGYKLEHSNVYIDKNGKEVTRVRTGSSR